MEESDNVRQNVNTFFSSSNSASIGDNMSGRTRKMCGGGGGGGGGGEMTVVTTNVVAIVMGA